VGGKLGNGHYEVKIKRAASRKIDRELLRQAVAGNPDAYLDEPAKPFGCTPQAVFHMLENTGITHRKRAFAVPKGPRKNAAHI